MGNTTNRGPDRNRLQLDNTVGTITRDEYYRRLGQQPPPPEPATTKTAT
jgi:hypothetical protein